MKNRTYLLVEYLRELWKAGALPKDAEAVNIIAEVLKDIQEIQKKKSEKLKG